jgi:hypothetical protein
MPCSLVEIYWHLHLEATYSCEALVSVYQPTWYYIPWDIVIHGHYVQNLESQKAEIIWKQIQDL